MDTEPEKIPPLQNDDEHLDAILEFSQQAITNHMGSLYSMYPTKISNNFFAIAIYKPLISTITNYYNIVLRSLILGDDPNLSQKFSKLASLSNHKEVCLVNMMFQLTLSYLHPIMENHHKFNKGNHEEYIGDIQDCMIKNTEAIKKKLIENIDHECKGQNLTECDPDTPLFSIKESGDKSSGTNKRDQ